MVPHFGPIAIAKISTDLLQFIMLDVSKIWGPLQNLTVIFAGKNWLELWIQGLKSGKFDDSPICIQNHW